VKLKGENALNFLLYSDGNWDNINDAFDTWGYLGLTVLRMSDVSEGLPRDRYAQFIDKYRGT
jgi:beta-amylase